VAGHDHGDRVRAHDPADGPGRHVRDAADGRDPPGQLPVADRLAVAHGLEEHRQHLLLQPRHPAPVDGQLEAAALPGEVLGELGQGGGAEFPRGALRRGRPGRHAEAGLAHARRAAADRQRPDRGAERRPREVRHDWPGCHEISVCRPADSSSADLAQAGGAVGEDEKTRSRHQRPAPAAPGGYMIKLGPGPRPGAGRGRPARAVAAIARRRAGIRSPAWAAPTRRCSFRCWPATPGSEPAGPSARPAAPGPVRRP